MKGGKGKKKRGAAERGKKEKEKKKSKSFLAVFCLPAPPLAFSVPRRFRFRFLRVFLPPPCLYVPRMKTID